MFGKRRKQEQVPDLFAKLVIRERYDNHGEIDYRYFDIVEVKEMPNGTIIVEVE